MRKSSLRRPSSLRAQTSAQDGTDTEQSTTAPLAPPDDSSASTSAGPLRRLGNGVGVSKSVSFNALMEIHTTEPEEEGFEQEGDPVMSHDPIERREPRTGNHEESLRNVDFTDATRALFSPFQENLLTSEESLGPVSSSFDNLMNDIFVPRTSDSLQQDQHYVLSSGKQIKTSREMLHSATASPVKAKKNLPLAANNVATEEWQILEKYFKDGVISTFKTKDQIEASKMVARVRQDIKSRHLAADRQQQLVDALRNEIQMTTGLVTDLKNDMKTLERDLMAARQADELLKQQVRKIGGLQQRSESDAVISSLHMTRERLEHQLETRRLEYDMRVKVMQEREKALQEAEALLTTLVMDVARVRDLDIMLRDDAQRQLQEQRVVAGYKATVEKQNELKRRRQEEARSQKHSSPLPKSTPFSGEQKQYHASQAGTRLEREAAERLEEEQQLQDRIKESLKNLSRNVERSREHLKKSNEHRQKSILAWQQREQMTEKAQEMGFEPQEILAFRQRQVHREREQLVQKRLQEQRQMEIVKKMIEEDERREKQEKQAMKWKQQLPLKKIKKVPKDQESSNDSWTMSQAALSTRQGTARSRISHSEEEVNDFVVEEDKEKEKEKEKKSGSAKVSQTLNRIPEGIDNEQEANNANTVNRATTAESKKSNNPNSASNPQSPSKALSNSQMALKRPIQRKVPMRSQPPLEQLVQLFTHPQIAAGKPFHGTQPFLSKPEIIQFLDFEPHRVYTQTFLLTNVSYTINTFKCLALPPEMEDLFTLDYALPGPLSAGLTCPLTLRFRSQENQDFIGEIPFLAATGPFQVRVECRTRKCQPRVQENRISFGKCIIYENTIKKIKIKNKGIIGTRIIIRKVKSIMNESQVEYEDELKLEKEIKKEENLPLLLRDENEEKSEEAKENDAIKNEENAHFPFEFSKNNPLYLPGHGQIELEMSFSPLVPGDYEQLYHLCFQVDDLETDALSPIALTLQGHGSPLPIEMDRKELDYGTCWQSQTYRQHFTLSNQGTLPFKFTCHIPPAWQPFIESVPEQGFVQPDCPLMIHMNVCFDRDLGKLDSMLLQSWNQSGEFKTESSEFRIPCKVTFTRSGEGERDTDWSHQTLCFELKGFFASTCIAFTPSNGIDFGSCKMHETIEMKLYMENTSILPMTLQFMRFPECISVTPSQLELKPKQKVFSLIQFKVSQFVGGSQFQHLLLCQVVHHTQRYFIPLKAAIEESSIVLSHSHIQFPILYRKTVHLEKEISHQYLPFRTTILMKNPLSTPIEFIFDLERIQRNGSDLMNEANEIIRSNEDLKNIQLSIYPLKGKLLSGQQLAISFSMHYNGNSDNQNVTNSTDNANNLNSHLSLLVPCHVTKDESFAQCTHFVRCDVDLAPVTPLVLSSTIIDFGRVAPGTRWIQKLNLFNKTNSNYILPQCQCLLDPLGCFQLVKAIRKILPLSSNSLAIGFNAPIQAKENDSFYDFMTLSVGELEWKVQVKASIAIPSFALETSQGVAIEWSGSKPRPGSGGNTNNSNTNNNSNSTNNNNLEIIIPVGDAPILEKVTKTFRLVNTSTCTLQVKIGDDNEESNTGTNNNNDTQSNTPNSPPNATFSVPLQSENILANQSWEWKVHFHPDQVMEYTGQAWLRVDGLERMTLKLQGRGTKKDKHHK